MNSADRTAFTYRGAAGNVGVVTGPLLGAHGHALCFFAVLATLRASTNGSYGIIIQENHDESAGGYVCQLASNDSIRY